MEKVRSKTGVPTLYDFASQTGTPVVIDDSTGAAYVLLNGVVTMIANPTVTPLLLVPTVTIDSGSALTTVTAANAGTIWNNFVWLSSGGTALNVLTAVLNYSGRGVLRRLLVMEKTALATAAYNAECKLTIDGGVIFDDATTIQRESEMRSIVGSLTSIGVDLWLLQDDPAGIPFNTSCKIEIKSDGVRTTSAGWSLSKRS